MLTMRLLPGSTLWLVWDEMASQIFWKGFPSASQSVGANIGQIHLNPQLMLISGAFEFIDLMKTADFSTGWRNTSFRFMSPANLDSNGYPTSLPFGDVQATVNTPGSERIGQSAQNYVILFDGTGTLIANGTSFTGTGAGNRNVLNVPGTGPQTITIAIHALPVTNIHVYHIDDEPDYLAGKIAGKQFKARIKQAQSPSFRNVVWMGTASEGIYFSNMTTWATRKPVSYVSYCGGESRPSLFAGTTTNSGSDYSITFGSGAPVNNQLIHLYFNASQADTNTYVAASNTSTLRFTNASTTVNWGTALPASVVVNAPILFGCFAPYDAPPEVNQFRVYYVQSVISSAAGTFTISATKGGAAISFSTGGGINAVAVRAPTLNLNSTGAVPIWDRALRMLWNPANNLIALDPNEPSTSGLGTLLYNSAINVWTLWGGQGSGGTGIESGIPPEIFLQFCAEIGCHPWFTSPQFACDPMTDWHTQLAIMCNNSAPSWMVPRFECINEPWNFGSTSGDFCRAMAFVNWPAGGEDHANEIGKIASTIGQDIDRIYGSAVRGTGTKYHLMVNPQTGQAPSFSDQLNSTSYHAQSSFQSGYNGDQAKRYLTHVCITQYMNVNGSVPNSAVTLSTTSPGVTWAANGLSNNAAVAFRFRTGGSLPAQLSQDTVYYIVNWAAGSFDVSATKGGAAITFSSTGSNVLAGSMADQPTAANVWNAATGNAAKQQIAIDAYLDDPTFAYPASAVNNSDSVLGLQATYQSTFTWCHGFTNDSGATIRMCGYEGGVALGQQNFPPQVELDFWSACMNTGTNLKLYCTENYNNFIAAGGEHPALFNLSCQSPRDSSSIWSALQDIYQSPDPQEWQAVVSFNH